MYGVTAPDAKSALYERTILFSTIQNIAVHFKTARLTYVYIIAILSNHITLYTILKVPVAKAPCCRIPKTLFNTPVIPYILRWAFFSQRDWIQKW